MTGNLKTVGLVLLAAWAMAAVMASSASAASEQEFHSDGERTILTGKNVGVMKFQIGAAGTVECSNGEGEATATGTQVSASTYKADTITVTGRTTGCTFGGQPATVKENHCATVLDSDTTAGNPDGSEHANVELECSEGSKIEIHTSVCTVTIGPQLVKHAVRYEKDTASSVIAKTTAKSIVVGKVRNTATQPINGCLVFPTGAVGTLTGTATIECFKHSGTALEGTDKTTPQGKTTEGGATECSVQ